MDLTHYFPAHDLIRIARHVDCMKRSPFSLYANFFQHSRACFAELESSSFVFFSLAKFARQLVEEDKNRVKINTTRINSMPARVSRLFTKISFFSIVFLVCRA